MKYLRENPNVGIVAILATIYLLLPIGFVYSDSFCYIFNSANALVPHYPPLYPSLLQLLKKVFGVNIYYVWAAMAVNFVLLVGAYLYWQTIIPARINKYKALIIFLVFNFPLLLNTKEFSSESVFLPGILVLFTASLRIAMRDGMRYLDFLVFFAAVAFLGLTRYIGVVFGAFLPLYLSLMFRRGYPLILKKFLVAVLLLFIAVGFNKCSILAFSKMFKTSQVATYGRPGLGRILLTLDEAKTPQERRAIINSWQSHTQDAELLWVMDEISKAKLEDLWLPLYNHIKEKLTSSYEKLTARQVEDKTDMLLNQAFICLILDADSHYFKAILERDVPNFFSNSDYREYLLENNRTAEDLTKMPFDMDYDFWKKRITRCPDNILDLAGKINMIINVMVIMFIIKTFWEKFKANLAYDEWALLLAVITIYLGYQCSVASVTMYLGRYALPVHSVLGSWLVLTLCRHTEWLRFQFKR